MADRGLVRRRGNSAAANNPPPPPQATRPSARPLSSASSRDSFRAPTSIRIRRLPSFASQSPTPSRPVSRASNDPPVDDPAVTGRRRSLSAPQAPERYQSNGSQRSPQRGPSTAASPSDLTRQRTHGHAEPPHMQTISETGPTSPTSAAATPGSKYEFQALDAFPGLEPAETAASRTSRPQNMRRNRSRTMGYREDEYEDDVVNFLDLIDPEVRAIGTLNNVQNSLFVPDLGGLINRRPTYDLTPRPTHEVIPAPSRSRAGTRRSHRSLRGPKPPPKDVPSKDDDEDIEMVPPRRTISIDSQMSDSRYAVLPHGVTLEDWTDEDLAELDDHVRHLMHSRREGFRRSMKGFRKYISRPLGLFVFIYATLVTLFGAAWVFFLIGWIYVGPRDRRDYITDIIDNVLVALFALIGDGLAPFRAVDTYHMCFIAHYHHLTWRLRKEQDLPNLVDKNDLPNRRASFTEADVVDREDTVEFSVLSPVQQRRLQYHQAKFSKAHTFYRPHETPTHHAFPLKLLVGIVVLLDCHSLLQIALGTVTWSIHYTVRPEALTATILSISITSNIAAGVLISIGDHQTRKKEVLERIFRQGLTEEAIRRIQKRHTEDKTIEVDPDAFVEEPADGSAPLNHPSKLETNPAVRQE